MSSNTQTPIFALVDCNNFYCSCERVFSPSLANRPLAVLSNNDGCIVARSNELKSSGIPMGAPVHQHSKALAKQGAAILSSNFQLYGDMSQRVMGTLKQFSPAMEIYSIDEAFLRLDGFQRDLIDYATHMRQTVLQWTGIPTSIGLGPNKTLAKVANHMAKKHTDSGVFNICEQSIQEEVLAKFPVANIWGIGRRLSKRLNEMGISTALKLRDMDILWVRKHFSIAEERLVRELRGDSCLELEEIVSKKNITSSKSFGKLVTDKQQVMEAIANYTARACHKLRAQNSKAQGVHVFLHTNPYRKYDRQYSNSMTYGFAEPSNDTAFIIRAARKCLDQIFAQGYKYNKAGIMLLDLVPVTYNQMELFDSNESRERARLMETIDTMNTAMGSDTVRFGSQGISHPWARRCEHRSPRYTTNWNELVKVR